MAKRFSIDGQAPNGTDKTILALVSATTIRPKIYDWTLGSGATPGDQAAVYVLQRFTVAGTPGAAVTPRPLDPVDPAAAASAGEGVYSAEPTYTADLILLQLALNQRASYRWVPMPGAEITLPNTAANGVGCKSISSTGIFNVSTTIHFEE